MNTKTIILICIALAMSITSCKDACKNRCQNGSACVDGNCVCDSAYTGRYCELLKCDVYNQGTIKINAEYQGAFVLYFYDLNNQILDYGGVIIYNPANPIQNDGVRFYKIFTRDVPTECYKVWVGYWPSVIDPSPDTSFYLNPCVEECQTTEIVLQRL